MSNGTPLELLAPAGDWHCLDAAIENGADAVYFGLDAGFNARARATNFQISDLPTIAARTKSRGMCSYLTLNTLGFPSELAEVADIIAAVAESGIDAVLVQDFGIARLIREICPQLTIHASTQMTLTCAEGIKVARELGIARVVLPRELSVAEIRELHQHVDIPLEVFVHGALCVAYSGQCLTSESLGGRSANRGQCAQACRLPYELIADGDTIDLGDQRYLLSPQDLAGYQLIPELIDAGVCSFKIEGRLKSPEYVANITRHYRQAIDDAVAGRKVMKSEQDVREMQLSFSRGFSTGWLAGSDHKALVPATSSSNRGVFLGVVIHVRSNGVIVDTVIPVKPGDGVVFEGDRAKKEEQGGRIFGVARHGVELREGTRDGIVELRFGKNTVDFSKLRIDQKVWLTDDPELTKKLQKTFTGGNARRRVPLDIQVNSTVGEPLRVHAVATSGATAEIVSDEVLAVAQKHPATTDMLREQFGRVGDTIYELRELSAAIIGNPMIPLSVIGRLRRQMIDGLNHSAGGLADPRSVNRQALSSLRSSLPERAIDRVRSIQPRLRVLCRSLPQIAAICEAGICGIIAEFQDLREYREAIEIASGSGTELFLTTTRIQKPGEFGLFNALMKCRPAGVLARNLSGVKFFRDQGVPVVADFSLNTANQFSAQYLIELGCQRATASYDLNAEQLIDLVKATPPLWLEVVMHQQMPMFHMEHCVFCSVMSPGTNKSNCGRPCDTHVVQLRDRIGMEHPLKADVGCRNTLFNAVPQSAAEVVPELIRNGVRDFRIELLDHTPTDARKIVALYQSLLRGDISGSDVWKKLKASNRVGVTRGTFEEMRNPLAIL